MILTEPEAKDKVCPILSARGPKNAFPALCLASGCMHWRWYDDAEEGCMQHYSTDPSDEDLIRDGWTRDPGLENRLSWRRPTPDRRGYCGLAGTPEHE